MDGSLHGGRWTRIGRGDCEIWSLHLGDLVRTQVTRTFASQWHDRMPLVLEPDTWDIWLKGDPEAAGALMKPANEDVLVSRPVSKAVGNVKNNGPELLAEQV